MDGTGRGSKIRSFAIGGVVGAAGAIATVRRASRPRRSRNTPGGLGAFADAPCFLELVEAEAQRQRDAGGETVTDLSNPT
ncbi:MAG TPA: hypothetical protein VIJ70_01485 [Gaiellaceae bacterium]